MPIDALFAISELRRSVSPSFTVHPLVHDYAYKAPRIARSAKRLGILRAKKEAAKAALEAGRAVLVYPGGDEDAFRTFSERNRIVLAGRKGFIRLAMETKTPIVPLVSVGLHESFIVLSKGRRIGQTLGIKKWLRTDIFPISLSFPWGIGPAFAPFLPLPTSIDMKFLSPIYPTGSPDNEEVVEETYHLVKNAMQSAMDELVAHRVPFFGQ
jgi:1-acyl-sn-glycerol-3-phosphate acyltransferase